MAVAAARMHQVSAVALAIAIFTGTACAQAAQSQSQSQSQPAVADAAAQAAGNPTTNQTGANQDRSGVEEIVVTAQFREQNLQDTPLAITAISGAMLEARSQTSIQDVANQSPSVTLKPQQVAFGAALGASIRGVGQFDFNPALEPGVGLYVDDVYFATLTGSILDLLDLDRVEILRGPQGTLAGKNSIGGAIKLYSKKPTDENSGYVSATYGIRNRIDLRGSANFALTDNVYARISGVSKKQDGFLKRLDFACINPPGSALNPAVGGVPPIVSNGSGSCVLGHEGEVDYRAVRGQLRYKGDRLEVNLIADYTIDDRKNAASILTFADNSSVQVRTNAPNVPYDSRFICGRYCNYATYFSGAGAWAGSTATGYPLLATQGNGRTRFKGYDFSGQIDLDISDEMQLQSITAYRAYNSQFSNDDDLSPLSLSNGQGDLHFHSFTQEMRLNGSFADKAIEYTVGGFYLDQKSVYATFNDVRYAPIPLQYQGNDPVNAGTKAAFLHLTWHVTDALSVIGGIRYTKENKDYTFSRRNRDGTLNPFLGAADGVVGRYSGDRVDYRANVAYKIDENINVYAQFSTGFKGGGVNPRPFNPAQIRSFGPETLKSYEIGFKSELFDRLARFNAALFYSKFQDIQLVLLSCPQFGGPGPCALTVNAGNADIKGFEAEASLHPARGLSIDGAVSLTDFKYTSIDPAVGGTGNPTGPQFDDYAPYTPRWKWSVGIQYEIDLGAPGSLTPRFDAAYQSTVYSSTTNAPLERIGHYTVANARLTWANSRKDLEISGEVTNLFNKYYFLTAFNLTGAGAGFSQNQPGRPREWAVTVKKKF